MRVDVDVLKSRLFKSVSQLKRGKCSIGDKASLNEEIKNYLEYQLSVQHVTERVPEIGHVLCALQEDEQFLSQKNVQVTTFFINNILWFYRPASLLGVEKRASHWAQTMFRCAFVKCVRARSNFFAFYEWKLDVESKILTMFQKSADYFCDRGVLLESVCFCSSILLRNGHLPEDNLESLLNFLPSSEKRKCPAVDNLFAQLSLYLSKGENGSSERSLMLLLASKSVSFRERSVLIAMKNWLKEDVPVDSWIVDVLCRDEKMFLDSVRMLHSLLIRFNYNPEFQSFVGHLIATIKMRVESLSSLYPVRMRPLVVLMEEEASEELRPLVYELFRTSIFTGLITPLEADMLTTHFPGWGPITEHHEPRFLLLRTWVQQCSS